MATTTVTSNKQQTTISSGATSMAELMAKQKQTISGLHKGENIKGYITKLTSSQVMVNIGGKSEAVVLEKDRNNMRTIMATLKVGDEVMVGVLNPESDLGIPVVSLRRFLDDLSWGGVEKAQKDQTTIEVTVTEITKGGAVVKTKSGLVGFLPQSHIQFSQNQQLSINNKLQLNVIELNRKDNRIIFSQKSTISDDQFAKISKEFAKDTKVNVQIVNITNFGIFVTLPVEDIAGITQVDGLIHISEVGWEKTNDLNALYSLGQMIDAVVIGSDNEARRLDLSIKKLTADPFAAIAQNFPVDKKVSGTIKELVDGNIHVDLGDSIEGIIRKEKVPPTAKYNVGDKINAVVAEVDSRRRRITLLPVLLEKPLGYR
ncbi:MAG TPA: S1 RNA-binding domain-containing protein [Patescibacteria group bacterium]|nr:S1 RNA-binding domain-containing protein [Patescibacteria group bacterium]